MVLYPSTSPLILLEEVSGKGNWHAVLAPRRSAGVALRGECEEIHHGFENKSRVDVTRNPKSASHKTTNALQNFQ